MYAFLLEYKSKPLAPDITYALLALNMRALTMVNSHIAIFKFCNELFYLQDATGDIVRAEIESF
jgi:hypothetical protein